MTSKNSFWVSLREDNKRRIWLWVLSWLFSLLYYVVGCALVIHGQRNYAAVRQLALSPEEAQALCMETVAAFLGNNAVLGLVVTAVAVLSGIQGFVYLYHKKRVDLYHSLPVKKSSRFLVIWLNGILLYLIPQLTGFVLGILIAASQGVMEGTTLCILGTKWILAFALYFALYNLNLIAVMLTGHVIITVFGVLVLYGYEFFIRLLAAVYMEEFFEKFIYGPFHLLSMWFSPYWYYASSYYGMNGGTGVDWDSFSICMGRLLLLGMVFAAIAYLLYRKRPAEAAGRALAFRITKPVIKMALAVPVTLAAAYVIKSITSGFQSGAETGSFFFLVLAVLITAAISCCLIEVIYEFDIKACLSRKKDILICGGLAALLYLTFRFDIVGFDAYIPQPDQLESYALVISDLAGTEDYFDSDGGSVASSSYIKDHMFLTDGEAVCRLAAIQPKEWEHVQEYQKALVTYRLKSGRLEERAIWLDLSNAETNLLLEQIVSSREYKKGAFMVMDDSFDQWLAKESGMLAQWQKGPYSFSIPEEEWTGLVEAYRQDIEFIGYEDISRTFPVGTVLFEKKGKPTPYYRGYDSYYGEQYPHYALRVYEDCSQTIAYLERLGIFMEAPLVREDVERIEVTNFNGGRYVGEYEGMGMEPVFYKAETEENRTVTVNYHTPGEIQEVSQAIYGGIDMVGEGQYYYERQYRELIDSNYQVDVYFKEGSNPYEHGYRKYTYGVMKEKMPYFVQEATKYRAE